MPANLPGVPVAPVASAGVQFSNPVSALPLTIATAPSKATQDAVKSWNSKVQQTPAEKFQQVVKVMLDHPEVVTWAAAAIQQTVKLN